MMPRIAVALFSIVMLAAAGSARGQMSNDDAYRRLQERDAAHNPRLRGLQRVRSVSGRRLLRLGRGLPSCLSAKFPDR